MEMIRQKLKQQKEKIQDEKLNSVQKNFIVHIFIKRLQLTSVESLRKCLMWPRFRKGFYQIGWKPGNMILDLETTFLTYLFRFWNIYLSGFWNSNNPH